MVCVVCVWWQSVVLCQLCSLLLVSVTVAVGCCSCCCGRVVVVGTEGRAGNVGCSSLLPRVVLGEVAAVAAAAQTVADLDVDDVVPLAAAVVASAARRYLVVEVEADSVEDPVAKAKAGRSCSRRSC